MYVMCLEVGGTTMWPYGDTFAVICVSGVYRYVLKVHQCELYCVNHFEGIAEGVKYCIVVTANMFVGHQQVALLGYG